MVEYINKYDALEIVTRTCGDYAAAFSEIRKLPGVSEAEIDRMKELAEADKEGRVVVLPCKTVYEPTWDAGPDCDLCCPVSIDGQGCCDFAIMEGCSFMSESAGRSISTNLEKLCFSPGKKLNEQWRLS